MKRNRFRLSAPTSSRGRLAAWGGTFNRRLKAGGGQGGHLALPYLGDGPRESPAGDKCRHTGCFPMFLAAFAEGFFPGGATRSRQTRSGVWGATSPILIRLKGGPGVSPGGFCHFCPDKSGERVAWLQSAAMGKSTPWRNPGNLWYLSIAGKEPAKGAPRHGQGGQQKNNIHGTLPEGQREFGATPHRAEKITLAESKPRPAGQKDSWATAP